MNKKILILVSYIILFINSNLLGNEKNDNLKIGLLAPLTGEYADLGNSLLYSLQLGLDEINDKNVFIIPRDAGFSDETKLDSAIQDLKSQGINIIIGPLSNKDFAYVKKYNDLIFISPSNIRSPFMPVNSRFVWLISTSWKELVKSLSRPGSKVEPIELAASFIKRFTWTVFAFSGIEAPVNE